MKINLIGMILNNAGRRCFYGALPDDDAGKPIPAADALHHMIMEYAKVSNGGESNVVTTSREVMTAIAAVADTYGWKPPVFKKHLEAAACIYTEHPGITQDTLTLRVRCLWVANLKPIIEVANKECANAKPA